jgi:hypothetical protein
MNKSTPLLIVLMASLLAAAIVFVSAGASIADKGGCPNAHSENGASHADENSAHGQEKRGERGCNEIVETATPAVEPTPTPTFQAEPTPTPTATAEATPTPTDEGTPTTVATPEPTPTLTPTEVPTATPTPTTTDAATPTPTDTSSPTPPPGADVEVVSVTVNVPVGVTAGVPFMLSSDVSVRNNGPVTPTIVDTTFTPVLPAGCTATTGVFTVQNTTLIGNLITAISRAWTVTCTVPGTPTFTMNANSAIDPLQPVSDPNPANNGGSGSSSTVVS